MSDSHSQKQEGDRSLATAPAPAPITRHGYLADAAHAYAHIRYPIRQVGRHVLGGSTIAIAIAIAVAGSSCASRYVLTMRPFANCVQGSVVMVLAIAK